jgi:hypothetical protein
MPLPLIPIITVLAAGGSLVPHAADCWRDCESIYVGEAKASPTLYKNHDLQN